MAYNTNKNVVEERKFCKSCERKKKITDFYTKRNGERCDQCKECFTLFINPTDISTIKPLLQELDFPYNSVTYQNAVNKCYAKTKNPKPITIFGKYLAQCRLNQMKGYGYDDSAELDEILGTTDKIFKTKQESIENAFEEGNISEEEYESFKATMPSLPTSSPFDTAPQIVECVDLPDFSSQLTAEDKQYLTLKYGNYDARAWVWMEQKYKEYIEAFEIKDKEASRISNLILLVKTDYLLNQALDEGDLDAVSRLSKVYDTVMKLGKFSTAQNKDDEKGYYNSYSRIFRYCEEKRGKIKKLDTNIDRDYADTMLRELKQWTVNILKSDPAIARKFEDYCEKQEAANIEQQVRNKVKMKLASLGLDTKLADEEYDKKDLQYDEDGGIKVEVVEEQ